MSNDDNELPAWLDECIEASLAMNGRLPNTRELLMWQEAEASCRMERE